MHWFTENSAAIQALTSAGSLMATIILACLTYRYVKLTREISTSAFAQLQFMKEARQFTRQQSAHGIKTLAFLLRGAFGRCLEDLPKHKKLRAFNDLHEQDIDKIESFAKHVDNQTVTLAVEAAASLRVMLQMIQKAKSIHENVGWIPTEEEQADWKSALTTSHRNLQALEKICEQIIGT